MLDFRIDILLAVIFQYDGKKIRMTPEGKILLDAGVGVLIAAAIGSIT